MFLSLFMLSLTTVLVRPCSKAPTLAVRSHVQLSRSRLHTAARQCSCCWGAAAESNPLSLASICWGSGARLGMLSYCSKSSQGAGASAGLALWRGTGAELGPAGESRLFSLEEPTGAFSHNLLSLLQPLTSFTPSFLGCLLADWYIRWNVLFLSFPVNWLYETASSPRYSPISNHSLAN